MIRDKGTKEIIGGASRAFVARAAGAVLSFGVGIAVARALGPDGAGVYFLAVTFAMIASVVGRLGLDQLVCKRTAAYAANSDRAGLQGMWRRSVGLALVVSLGVSALLIAFAPLAARLLAMDELAAPLRRIGFAVVPLSLFALFGELLRGLKRAGASQVVQLAVPPGLTLCSLAVLGPFVGWTPATVTTAYTCGAVCAAALGFVLWRRATPWLAGVKGVADTREIVRAAVPFLGVAVLGLIVPWLSVLSLGYFGDEADVGVFSVAYRVAMLASFVLTAVNVIAAPRFAALYARGQRAELARSARQATLIMTICALPILLVAWVFPGPVMSIFGPRFTEGARCLTILAGGQFFNVITGSVGALLMMSGHERALRTCLAASVFLSLVLHLLLVPRYGIEGAAAASAITLAVNNVAMFYLVRRYLRIDMIPLPFRHRSGD